MCELMGMSANVPTDICFSLRGLMQRGGATGPHRDGWGVIFYEGRGIREFRDPLPGAESEVARLIQQYPIKSRFVISHIRQANVGAVCLENTHPFVRELWGNYWSFAHNGQLAGSESLPLGIYQPVGTTDSERAFCWLLAQLREQFDAAPDRVESLCAAVKGYCDTLRGLGVFNLLLCDSRYLFVYCSTKLHWITRRSPFGEAHLKDAELSVDFAAKTTPNDIVTVVATEPLTANEPWQAMEAGQLLVFRDGLVVAQS